jgi:hypothetical protein
MKKLLVIALMSAVTYLVWHRQRPVLEGLRIQNQRLVAVAADLKERARLAESAQQSAEQQFASLRLDLKSRAATASDQVNQNPGPQTAPALEPDPTHQGGWPSGAGFFYLPKQYLTNAS